MNVAARLEAHAKVAPCALLLDAPTLASLGERLLGVALGPVQFKGKGAAVEVFGLAL